MKVAILDTGIDLSDLWLETVLDDIKAARKKQGFSRGSRELHPIAAQWPSEDAARDECGHGTWVAYLILLYAPEVDLYVAKISDGMEIQDYDRVVHAIDWAVSLDVDIINMSFGTQIHVKKIEQAIIRAATKAGHPTVMFAAASNYGLNDPRAFPARDERVICVHAFDGTGGLPNINPPRPKGEASIGTLGCSVKLHFNGKSSYRSGTSYASPILAAITANLLDWLDHQAHRDGLAKGLGWTISASEYAYLRNVTSIRKILVEHMSWRREDLHFVAPWILFHSNQLSEVGPEGDGDDTISPEEVEKVARMEWCILGTLTHKIPETE